MSALVEALELLGRGQGLTSAQSASAVSVIMAGEASDVAIAAFLTALRIKGETADELSGAVGAIRERMEPLEGGELAGAVDTCGTGGDGAKTVNVSTASAIVVAACGVPVAKHGNRSASGNSGSAEVLSELGVAIDADLGLVRRCLRELGITFLFAPRFHPALRHAAAVRKQLPFRTLFNLVGPLANPARPPFQLVGTSTVPQADLLALTLGRLGIARAAVVTGADGLDEVTLDGPTHVRWVEGGEVRTETWTADDFGLPRVRAAELCVSGPAHSAECLRRLFAGEGGPTRSSVLANSAAALRVAGAVGSLADGTVRARRALDSGAAAQLLERWRRLSREAS